MNRACTLAGRGRLRPATLAHFLVVYYTCHASWQARGAQEGRHCARGPATSRLTKRSQRPLFSSRRHYSLPSSLFVFPFLALEASVLTPLQAPSPGPWEAPQGPKAPQSCTNCHPPSLPCSARGGRTEMFTPAHFIGVCIPERAGRGRAGTRSK